MSGYSRRSNTNHHTRRHHLEVSPDAFLSSLSLKLSFTTPDLSLRKSLPMVIACVGVRAYSSVARVCLGSTQSHASRKSPPGGAVASQVRGHVVRAGRVCKAAQWKGGPTAVTCYSRMAANRCILNARPQPVEMIPPASKHLLWPRRHISKKLTVHFPVKYSRCTGRFCAAPVAGWWSSLKAVESAVVAIYTILTRGDKLKNFVSFYGWNALISSRFGWTK